MKKVIKHNPVLHQLNLKNEVRDTHVRKTLQDNRDIGAITPDSGRLEVRMENTPLNIRKLLFGRHGAVCGDFGEFRHSVLL